MGKGDREFQAMTKTCLLKPCLLALLWPARVQAHNGAVAIAVPVAGITIDGDFSDWPAEMRRYPILLQEDGGRLKGWSNKGLDAL